MAIELKITANTYGVTVGGGGGGSTYAHGASFSVTASEAGIAGFGTKDRAMTWDNGDAGLTKWSGAVPNSAGGGYDISWRAPHRGIALPHSNISTYLAGCHYGNSYDAGWDVMVWKVRSGISAYPIRTYASWYQRCDSAWDFGLSGTPDSNYKCFQIDDGTEPYNGAITSNFEFNPRPTSLSATPAFHLYNGGSPDRFSPPVLWASGATNPMSGVNNRVSGRVWAKIEWEVYHSTGPDGYALVWEDGVLKVGYSGVTARGSEGTLTLSIGGYSRDSGSANNWRYFADICYDDNINGGRFVLANNATLSSATIREAQPWSSWSDTSVSLTCNKGALDSGTVHLHYLASGGSSTYVGARTIS